MIVAEGLTKIYRDKSGDVRAAQNVSFEARPGESLGILGVNGAGKTTTLRMLATLLEPTSGRATVAGYDVSAQPLEVRKNLGFLSSTTALYGKLKPRELLLYFASLHDMAQSEARRRTDELMAALEIEPFANRLCDRLSTGQKQRVSLARTLLNDPPVLILDEPTAGLDVLASRAIAQYIDDHRARGKTILFSSHIMSEIERLCDRAIVIHEGRVVAQGRVSDLIAGTGEQRMEAAFLKLIEAA